MQWNDLKVLPEDNAIVLVYVKNDNGDEKTDAVATAKFEVGKGWSIGFRGTFDPLNRDFTVSQWMQIPLPL